VPDIVLDDGSHKMEHVNATFDFIYPRMSKNTIYMIEDMHTSYLKTFGGGLGKKDAFINRSKTLVDKLYADQIENIEQDDFSLNTISIHFYKSIVVFEKGDVYLLKAPKIGEST